MVLLTDEWVILLIDDITGGGRLAGWQKKQTAGYHGRDGNYLCLHHHHHHLHHHHQGNARL